ncbi:hypothetical protein IVG45_01655 [Methylomonas sp. LL1]|uniref:hypothetical protein n=1 Tax=Methylomonas sp. LL1 TaxID=2785785 RepID=UPI0018C3DFC8|nr:hypothetical protein [Methylomonas sp. LL1]QPK63711.1 hypothetical protein IVG45_01655 [Methylomonas sp. LL1]CAG0989265.1 hypothetical protein ANRL3_02659 [Anaerolineae bacterium]
MSLYLAMRLLLLSSLFFLLPGCAGYNSAYSNRPADIYDPYAQSGIDELLAFGASMANMPESGRADVCRSLLNTQKLSPSDGKQLHLMVGRLLSEACGDIPRILDGVQAVSPGYASDERVQRLIAIHTQTLTRMHNQSKKLNTAEQKQKKVKTVLESKETAEPKKDENRLLREKLDAIRSMEKQMDESVESN